MASLPQEEMLPVGTELHHAPKIFKEDCEIRFAERTAEEIHNFVRGLSPYPAAWANLTINDQYFENVKIYQVKVQRDKAQSTKEIIIPCREGAVKILELQVPGKKRMDARSFLNGRHA